MAQKIAEERARREEEAQKQEAERKQKEAEQEQEEEELRRLAEEKEEKERREMELLQKQVCKHQWVFRLYLVQMAHCSVDFHEGKQGDANSGITGQGRS